MMKLYTGPLSLYSRKVEIALGEKRLAFEREFVAFDQTVGYSPKHSAVLAANPKGQVPVLVDGGLTLYDSTVICEYLEDAYPSPALLPYEAAERALCRQLELYADEVMLAPLRALMHRTGPRPDAARWEEREAKAREAIGAIDVQWAELDARLGAGQFLGGALTVADIAAFMMVLFGLRLGGPALSRHANLARWYRGLLGRPAFAKAAREMAEADARLSAPVPGAYEDGTFAPPA